MGALLAIGGGIAAALGHAPFHLWFIAVPGFALAIWRVSDAVTPWRAFGRSWLAGLAYFAVTLQWIVEPFLVDAATHGWMAPFALALMAGGLALFWGLAGAVAFRISDTLGGRAIAFALTLTLAEYLRGHIFTGFPWAMPAYIWADTPLRASVAWFGSYGLTALTLLGAALPFTIPRYRAGLMLSVACFGGLYLLGMSTMTNENAKTKSLGTVRMVAPNVPQTEKWVRDKVPGHIERLLDLTRGQPNKPGDFDMVVWPEVAIAYPLDSAGSILAQAVEASGGKPVITGINRRENEDWFNSAIVIGPDGTVQDAYDKVHLVPFGEYIPFRLNFIRVMAGSGGFGFSSGEAVKLLDTPLGKALVLICYEGIFPGHIFQSAERPDYLLQITNDAWFGKFSGPYQHLDQARFRAAEQGLPMVRVANVGVSAVIDPYGVVYPADQVPLGESGYQDSRVWSKATLPLYARTGDLPVIVFLLVTMIGLSLLKRRNTLAKQSRSS